MPYKDPEKRREYARLRRLLQKEKIAECNKRYYEQNRDAILEHQRCYRDVNREAIREVSRKYYEANKDKINDSRREYYRDYYRKNRDRLLLQNKENGKKNRSRLRAGLVRRRKELANWLWEFKCGKACSCGEDHPACLDFHHLDPKLKENLVSKMVCEAAAKDRIIAEIKKCILICSNCHRKLHAHRTRRAAEL